jgi:DNA helicase-2/ATP-dependent DNA helicase PcrA
MESLLSGLNPKQKKAVEATEGPLLILAGAGSGKTKTIIHRIAYLIEYKNIRPYNILAITFTNKAAGEMRDRVASMNIENSEFVWINTFHSFSSKLMRMHADRVGYNRNFIIYDADDQKRLIKNILKELSINDKDYPHQYIASKISDAKNKFQSPEKYEKNAADFREETVAQVYKEYQKKLRTDNAMDFDDLIFNTLKLLKTDLEIREKYQNKFQYLVVDEYQDTNNSQYQIIHLLSEKHQNICVCGDDDQSIYRWRGADIGNILNFEKDYTNARVIKLEQNYRSTSPILKGANAVISNNKGRKSKELWTENPGEEKIIGKPLGTGNQEAAYIAEKILELRKTGYLFGDFAVLYRTNAQSRLFEEVMMREGIPFQLVGGTRFFARKEIKDILAYLSLLVNPKSDIHLMRVINVPKRGIGTGSIDKIRPYGEFKGYSLLETILKIEECPGITKGVQTKFMQFKNIIIDLKIKEQELSLSELIKYTIEITGYKKMLEENKIDKAEDRLENLEELVSSAAEFEKQSDDKSLEAYLESASLAADLDGYESDEGKVLLMTLHNAKGLEFPVVFLPGLEEGIFPHFRSLDNTEELEEERRLCYVGITRAQKRLFITWAEQRMMFGRPKYHFKSPFVDELPVECFEIQEDETRRRQNIKTKQKSSQAQQSYKNEVNKTQDLFSDSGIVKSPKIKNKDRNITDIKEGVKVKHQFFGIGTVVEKKGVLVSIAFPGKGIKKLAADVAPLEIID